MSSVIDEVTGLCSRSFQTGARAYQTGSLLLHGSPAAAGWLLGWLASEFGPHVLTGHALSAVPSPLRRMARGLAVQQADTVLEDSLRETFGDDYPTAVHHPLEPYTARHPNLAALVAAMRDRRRYSTTTSNISYGPGGRNKLDIWRRPDLPDSRRAPVLIQVPGGGWSINDKRGQAYPLMSRMVELGWICVPINYSRSPGAAWPAHITDVKRAIAWVRANIADYGGDPDFIAITGGSAGGHLSALAALTADDDRLQPGFEDADTSVQAAVPHYGLYDLTDKGSLHSLTMPLLEHLVMQRRFDDNRQLFEDASPIFRVHRNARPSSSCTVKTTMWFRTRRPEHLPGHCARPAPAPCPTPRSPMRTTPSTPLPPCAARWRPRPSRRSSASSTAVTWPHAVGGGRPARPAERRLARGSHRDR